MIQTQSCNSSTVFPLIESQKLLLIWGMILPFVPNGSSFNFTFGRHNSYRGRRDFSKIQSRAGFDCDNGRVGKNSLSKKSHENIKKFQMTNAVNQDVLYFIRDISSTACTLKTGHW